MTATNVASPAIVHMRSQLRRRRSYLQHQNATVKDNKMTAKQKALEKLRLEINKDIDFAIKMAESCGLFEFLYFIYQLHWIRLLHLFPNAENQKPEILNAYTNTIEESIKYIASLIAKFGHWGFNIPKVNTTPFLNIELVQMFLKHGNLINSKYETESFIQLFDVQVSGERNQYLRIDMSNVETDPDARILFNYFLRIDEDNDIKKSARKNKDALIQNFKDEYYPFSDLFEKEMGITIDEFCWLNDQLLLKVTDELKLKGHLFEKLSNGNVDVKSQITFFYFSQCLLQNKQKLLQSFDSKFHPTISRLTFKTEQFDERQLRFHHVTRQPIFEHEQMVIISPELILDSLFTNIHYSLIESPSIKQEYIAKQSSLFLDKIAIIAKKYNYSEVEREKDLFEGKNQIGDVDIILKNQTGQFLLIEAKNHVLPMDIYFHDVIKTQEHLLYLQKEWEKKVLRRVEHLKSHHDKYSIPKDHSYIVVSRFPEIISHYSSLLVLSIQEFEFWLEKFKMTDSFNDFHEKYYEKKDAKFTIEEMEEMQKANLFFGQFAKE